MAMARKAMKAAKAAAPPKAMKAMKQDDNCAATATHKKPTAAQKTPAAVMKAARKKACRADEGDE